MARPSIASGKKALSGAKRAVKRTIKKVTARLRPSKSAKAATKTKTASPRKKTAAKATGRTKRVEADIPVETLNRTYTPPQTSLKGPFRANGAGRQRDQEMSRGVADDRWNDEDRLTNKSGDPRIGTHGRTYEPGE